MPKYCFIQDSDNRGAESSDRPQRTTEQDIPSPIAFAAFDRDHGTVTQAEGSGLPQLAEWQTIFLAALNVTRARYASRLMHFDANGLPDPDS